MWHKDVLVSRGGGAKNSHTNWLNSAPEKDVMVAARRILSTKFQHDPASTTNDQQVTVTLAEIHQALADAVYHDRAWLQDFLDDEITISRDFHQVLRLYDSIRRAA